jgi:Rv2525c-like, glycoside hydrolase-like domain
MRAPFLIAISLFVLYFRPASMPAPQAASPHAYLGFDRNDYPGDSALPVLRKFFSFSSYWLGFPPGEKSNSWQGKRALMQSEGFGFLLLYTGPESRQLKSVSFARARGNFDARKAVASARSEGFRVSSVIYLDIEEGGRLPPSYHAYVRSWTDEIRRSGFRAGVYCSGEIVDEGDGNTIITSDDIRNHLGAREISYWVYNDSCPPSPGCIVPQNPPPPSVSGIAYAAVWQFVRSPRDPESAVHCTGYAANGNCYIALDTARQWHLDLDVASSPDPSQAH